MQNKDSTIVKTVYEVPEEFLRKIELNMALIREMHESLQLLGKVSIQGHLTIREFMRKARISRNLFEHIKDQLVIKRASPRKFLIPESELNRWLAGEIKPDYNDKK